MQKPAAAVDLSVLVGIPVPVGAGGTSPDDGHGSQLSPTTRKSPGGILAAELPMIEGLRKCGVFVQEESYGSAAEARADRSAIERARAVLATAGRLKGDLRERPFDVVHINTAFDRRGLLRDAAVMSLLPRTRAAIFVKFHGSDAALVATGNPMLRALARRLFGRISMAGVLSGEEKANFVRAGFPGEKILVVKNILAPGDVYRPDPAFREREGIGPGTVTLLFSGRLMETKGILDLVRALPVVRERGGATGKVLLLCCGDGPARDEVVAETERLGVSEMVRMYGHIPEERMRDFYANADVLVLPTYHQEGFPMAVFQAVAAGLPVITTRIRGAAEYLGPENALWVEPRNPAQLAERIVHLVEHPDERRRMGDNNRELARRFRQEPVVAEYLDIYRELVRPPK